MDTNITIKKASGKYVAEMIELLHECWLVTYSNESLGITKKLIDQRFTMSDDEMQERKNLYDNPPEGRLFLLAFEHEKLIGLLAAGIRNDGFGEIKSLYVLPQYHRMKIGTKLMELGLEWLQETPKVIIHCADYNSRALAFYQSFDFEIDPSVSVEPFVLSEGVIIPEVELFRFNKGGRP